MTGTLTVGNAGTGHYYLNNGRLESGETVIGETGVGSFTHSLGKHVVTNNLYLARGPSAQATCNITGGTLTVEGNIYIGYTGGTGDLVMAGGVVTDGGIPGVSYVYTGSKITGYGMFDKPVDNTGEVRAAGGVLTLAQTYAGSGDVTIEPGAILDLRGNATIDVSDLHVGLLQDGTDAPGGLELNDPSSVVVVSSSYTLHPQGTFSAVPGAQLIMTGSSFLNLSPISQNAMGLNNLTVIFEGGNSDLDPIEVACMDFGPEYSALNGNFALGTLSSISRMSCNVDISLFFEAL